MNYWAIHFNSDVWDIKKELQERNEAAYMIDEDDMEEIHENDQGIIWASGKNAAVYSKINITSEPFENHFQSDRLLRYAKSGSRKIFMGKKKLVNVEFSQKLIPDRIVKKEKIMADPELKKIFHTRKHNSIKLSEEAYNKIVQLIR